AEAVEVVRDRLMVTPEASFEQLLTGCQDRIEVVVRFLALLELYREGKVELRQATVFGEIQVRWQGSERVADGLKKDRAGEEGESLEWKGSEPWRPSCSSWTRPLPRRAWLSAG